MTSASAASAASAPRRARLSPAERRETILAAATEVFARSGYQKAKMSDVAAAIGVTEPVVFQNFGSKAQLYVAVIRQAGEQLGATVQAFGRQGLDIRGLLTSLLSPEHVEALHSPGHPGVIFADAMSLAGDPVIGAAARETVGRIAESFSALIAEGRERGELRAGLDPEAAAWAVLSLLASHQFRRAVMPDRGGLERGVSEIVLKGLLDPE